MIFPAECPFEMFCGFAEDGRTVLCDSSNITTWECLIIASLPSSLSSVLLFSLHQKNGN